MVKMGFNDRALTFGTLFSVLCILYSIYRRDPTVDLQERLVRVINGLIQVEDQHITVTPKVVIGYGACVDLFVNAKDLLPYKDEIGFPEHFDNINSMDEFYKSFAYFFQHGAASERFMTNSSLFDALIKDAETLPDSRYAIGGNAPVMAMRLFHEGCDVTLASTLTPKHLKNIPSGIKVVGDTVARDDIHLILEYKAQEKWGPYIAPRANRYILHNDQHNPYIRPLEALQEHLSNTSPDLFVVSALQLMDNYGYPNGVRTERLKKVMKQIKSLPRKTKIHFEMASFTEEALIKNLQEYIIPYVDSIGMNEQELANLYSVYKYGNISFVSDSRPRVAVVLDHMRSIFKILRSWSRLTVGTRRLNRIHVHTLAFQAILTTKDSPWKQNDVAAAKASLTAFRHVCDSSQVEADRATVLMDDSFSLSIAGSEGRVWLKPEETPVPCWDEGDTNICVAPGLVCKHATKTAGGGDNISAAALAVQL